jgi:methionyl aminopeptidase
VLLRDRETKIGRNDPCPCGSGLKYKKCCLGKEIWEIGGIKERYLREHNIRLKERADIAAIEETGRLAIATLQLVESHIAVGIRTDDINSLVHQFTSQNGATPAPLNYRGFPKSVCVSVNDEICHGIPGERVLKDGDIVNVDVTPILNGYYSDASKTVHGESRKKNRRHRLGHSTVCGKSRMFSGKGVCGSWGRF